MIARNVTRDRLLGNAIRRAETFAARSRGLLGRSPLREGEGLWICPCRSIHSVGMRFPFDALFVDAGMRVVALYSTFPRNRFSRYHRDARGVLELPAGAIERSGTEVGDLLEFPD
ncbi:MAG: DUF192 domain-containing protein [Deltaproteobacteria bacterium]|nr:DUF192 domain-containing protein [Deltaproteobacteria bacterium]